MGVATGTLLAAGALSGASAVGVGAGLGGSMHVTVPGAGVGTDPLLGCDLLVSVDGFDGAVTEVWIGSVGGRPGGGEPLAKVRRPFSVTNNEGSSGESSVKV